MLIPTMDVPTCSDEDFDKSNPITIEPKNDSHDDENECDENKSLENKSLNPPDSKTESILSREGTVW